MGITTQGELSTALILLGAEVEGVRIGDRVERVHTLQNVRVYISKQSSPKSRTAVLTSINDQVAMLLPKRAMAKIIRYLENRHE